MMARLGQQKSSAGSPTGQKLIKKTYMRSLYDNVLVSASIDPQSLTSSAVNGSVVDTEGYNTAILRFRSAAATGSPTPTATIAVKLQEGTKSDGSDMADALDNTGTVIGGTVSVISAAGPVVARIEGLGLNRKRYLRVVATPNFVGGTTPAALGFGEIILGRAFSKPVISTVSNT